MNYEERVKAFNDELTPFLDKHGFKFKPLITFPQYNILPVDLQLALKIIEKHEPKFDITLIDQRTDSKE